MSNPANSNNNNLVYPSVIVLPCHLTQIVAAAHTLVELKFNLVGHPLHQDFSKLPIDPENYKIHNSNNILDPYSQRTQVIDLFNKYCQAPEDV